MKLSEIKGERALDVIADLMDPVMEIVSDAELKKYIDRENRLEAVKYLLKNYKKQVITCMAILHEEDPDKYEPSLVTLPAMLLELLNEPELATLFYSGGTVTSSGSATETTEEDAD